MQTYFYQLADFITSLLTQNEIALTSLSAEESNFVRFNKSAVRQAGSVKQIGLTLSLIANQRRAESRLTLSGLTDSDHGLIRAALDTLRRDLGDLPEDPFLLFSQTPVSTEHIGESKLPSDEEMLAQVIDAGRGKDLVGFFASGAIYKGFANSLGQRNWHRVDNFNFEWCLYHAADKAVKSGYAGGKSPNPTYPQVCNGNTGHAEVVQVTFDPAVVSYREVLDVFFATHDPTTLNRQGADAGTQYRSVVFYHTPEQQAAAEQRIAELNAADIWDAPIVTQVVELPTVYKAEDYHQEYFRQNPTQPYCQAVVSPKVAKFRKQFVGKLKG